MAASEAISDLEAKTEFNRALARLRLDPASRPLFEALAALTACANVENYLWHKLRGAEASGVWRILATPETLFLRSFEQRLKRLLAEEAAFARGELPPASLMAYVPPVSSVMADCDPLAGAQILVDDFSVVVKTRDGTKHYRIFPPLSPPAATVRVATAKPVVTTKKVRRGGGKRGPSYELGDKIKTEILQWAAANKGVSPLPTVKQLWAEENKGVKTPPSDMTFRRRLAELGL